ncbi:MAG: hypothetical protein KF729_20450 [Sandaracinaceae bacterium]|nr:hypothetical protein [Sandaracinaceae bacterium]
MAERRLSTPLVLAVASAMLAIGAVVWLGREAPDASPTVAPRAGMRVDGSSPERAAESFYDAWRRRRWEEANALSIGDARRAVAQKRAADAELANDERVLAERGWDALAAAPLTLSIEQVDLLGSDRFALTAVAAYDFVGTPYRRRVALEVHGTPAGYRVARMELGEVLTELPPIFRGGAAP